MLIRTSHILIEIVAALLAGLVLIAAVGAWRLSQGPVSLGFLRPYVDDALARIEGPLAVELDDVILKWAGWDRALDIIVVGAQVRSVGGAIIAAAPEVSVSFGAMALLSGEIAPTKLELIGPALHLLRTQDGRFQLGMGRDQKPSDEALPLAAQTLLAPIDSSTPIGGLRKISIIGGRLTVDDHASGVKWGAPHADIRLSREADGLDVQFDLDVALDGQKPSIQGTANFRLATVSTEIEARVRGLRPDALAAALPALAPLSGVKLPVDGLFTVRLGPGGALDEARFELEGGKGELDLPHPHLRRLAVASVGARGSLAAGGSRLVLEGLTVDLGGPIIELRAVVTRNGEAGTFEGEATIRRMAFDRLSRYWPPDVAEGGRRWIFANLADGTIPEARAKVVGRFTAGQKVSAEISQLKATAELRGFTVHYLRPLYPVRKVDATAVISQDRMDIGFRAGNLEGMTLREGTLAMTALDKDIPWAAIEVVLGGSIEHALQVVDHPKLRYASRIGFDAATVRGQAAIRLVTRLPLTKSVTMDEVELKAAANLSGVSAPRAILGRDLGNGRFTVQLDRQGMNIEGKAKLDGVDGDVKWYENFLTEAPYSRRYDVNAVLDDAARRRFGLDFQNAVAGPVAVNLVVIETASSGQTMVADLDLTPATLTLARLGWSKAAGQPGKATFEIALKDGRITEIPAFQASAAGLVAQGSVQFGTDGKTIRTARFSRFSLGRRTNFHATARRIEDGTFVITLSGPSLDLAPLLEDRKDGKNENDPHPLKLHAKVDRLWIGPDTALGTIESVVHFDGETWRRISVDGAIGENRRLVAHYRNEAGHRRIEVKSADAGGLLNGSGLFGNMRGGSLSLTGERTGGTDEVPWKGRLKIDDFRIVKAPIIARLLTLASLTGISNLVSGEGIRFETLDMPFAMKSRRLSIFDARAVGSEIGITARGDVDLGAERVALEGTLVPAYTINSILGAIPILGKLLTGDKGGGVFAATYKIEGPFESTKISVNPLAALTPGFLRDLVRGIGRSSSPAPIDPPLND